MARNKMTCIWICVMLFCVCATKETLSPWINFTFDSLQDDYKITEKMPWWDAANFGCDFEKGILLPHNNIPQKLKSKMKAWKKYWVGALEVYTPWKWTEDKSSIFLAIGSLNVSGYEDTLNIINANDPYLCHKLCSNGNVGLQGRYCYCLRHKITPSVTHSGNIRCPGSFDQYCGDENSMTVYDVDAPQNLTFDHHNQPTCGYLYTETDDNDYIYKLTFTRNCENKFYYACPKTALDSNNRECDHNVCISTNKATWRHAMNTCKNKLFKLTTDVMKHLQTVISNSNGWNWWSNTKLYWIGLTRNRKCKWINGTDFAKDLLYYSERPSIQECIAVYRTYSGHLRFIPKQCSTELRAFCQL
ncbi:uncharacterized protein LOC121392031, partial [Gigantopelta aegis]|uniref:uncharacterized protein LOC121392031 n=1 Tax=Gigantopelta aegis TaxID=1735272 RepID=UPI001B8889C4